MEKAPKSTLTFVDADSAVTYEEIDKRRAVILERYDRSRSTDVEADYMTIIKSRASTFLADKALSASLESK